MHLSTPTLLLALLAGTSSASRLISRQYLGTTAIIGTFQDGHCAGGQLDDSDTVNNHYGHCREFPDGHNIGMKIWWLKEGCTETAIVDFSFDSRTNAWTNSAHISGPVLQTGSQRELSQGG
ncbi:hypothetical protein BCR34DRAFT_585099 [Clohesyomyces aquaticus]|uniref:Uncharacterized protein n=1 Tax=Clohesyomyces aquaticus TaxID=1231657 RepID=A0A1Y2A0A0_9PLEO|nr:hypothetical protein BCR34DRAFT_585099 [Clohesyomyces aquaticus]